MVIKMYISTSEALKILLNEKENTPEIKRQIAFKKLAEVIADDECNEHKMTYQEWEHIVKDYKAKFEILNKNNKDYLKSLIRE